MKHLDIKLSNKKGLVAGVVNLHSLHEFFYEEEILNGIDLGYEEAVADMEAEGKSEEEIEEELEFWEQDSVCILFGDWKKNSEGKYEIDYNGPKGFAGTYSNSSGAIVTLEWSKHSAKCHHTSPCYVMCDGRPCGDLDTEGDSVEAYCFSKDEFNEDNT